ncbi:MAG TPA: hypothetical protein VGL81_00860 [Polyangiaceae bacterium]
MPRRNELPVIPRIVRRTTMEQLLEPLVSVARAVRRAGGMLVFGALGVGTLGTIAVLGLGSQPGEAAPVVSGAARPFDATATERMLARAPAAPRVDRILPPPVPRVVAAAPAPVPVPAPVRVAPAPAHATFTASHVATHAARKHAASSVVAHR